MADRHRDNPEHSVHLEHPENLGHPVHHEESDVNIRAILGFGAALVVVAAVVHLLIYVLFGYFTSRENAKVPSDTPSPLLREIACRQSRGYRPTRARTSRICAPRKTSCSDRTAGSTGTRASSASRSMPRCA